MKYQILNIRANKTIAGPGEFGFDAEAFILDENNREHYVYANIFDEYVTYALSKTSVYDYMVEDEGEEPSEYEEQYESLEDAYDSKYFDLFVMLDKILYQLAQGPERRKGAFILQAGRTITEFEGADEYRFGAFRRFKYEGKTYEAGVSVIPEGLVIATTKGKDTVETYDDMELAAYSRWFGVYYSLKKELAALVKEYVKQHPESKEDLEEAMDLLQKTAEE